MDTVEQWRAKHERELQRLGDAGDECSQRGGKHQAGDFFAIFRSRRVIDSQCSPRQTKHKVSEAASHKPRHTDVVLRHCGVGKLGKENFLRPLHHLTIHYRLATHAGQPER